MTRQQLEHITRAAAATADVRNIVVIGGEAMPLAIFAQTPAHQRLLERSPVAIAACGHRTMAMRIKAPILQRCFRLKMPIIHKHGRRARSSSQRSDDVLKDDQYQVSLRECLCSDRISLPTIATRLRAWARQRGDVERLVLGHNGAQYTLAVLLKDAAIQCAGEAESQLYDLMPFQPGTELQIFTLDAEHSNDEMLNRPGGYDIHDDRITSNQRVA